MNFVIKTELKLNSRRKKFKMLTFKIHKFVHDIQMKLKMKGNNFSSCTAN